MARVSVRRGYRGSVYEAQTCWCEVSRWPEWVDGVARVVSVDRRWPEVGSAVVWDSGPAGRGRVSERVLAFEPLAGLTLLTEDTAMRGEQRVAFEPTSDGVEIEVRLEYRLRRRTPVTPLLEWLFVRRPMTLSLSRTLERFGPALLRSRAAGLG